MSSTRRHLSIFLALLVVLQPIVLTGCSSMGPTDKRILQYLNREGFGRRYTGNSEEENYVTIGDGITFLDTYNPDFRGTTRVAVDGTIQVPEVGTVHVAGMTRSELETYLTQRAAPYYVQTDVKVNIKVGGNRVYYVVGEVGKQGPRPFKGNLTVFDAVLLAGPREHTSNLGRVRVIRADPRDPTVIPTPIPDLWEAGDSTYNILIQENDIIFVPPTLMKQAADFVAGILVPFTSVFRSVFQVLLQFARYDRFQNNDRFI